MKKTFGILMLNLIIPLLFGMAGCSLKKDDGAIHIAAVGPMTGENHADGEEMVNGMNLYIEEINKNGGINGKKVILDIYDDQNDPDTARKRAKEITDQNQAAAVIGHLHSACSITAGKIYKKNGIPAISPTSTRVPLTRENDWYFRIIYDDEQQGAFLAYYAKEILGQTNASIAYGENDDFCRYLAQAFEETCKEIGIEVRYKWALKCDAENPEQFFQNIAGSLKSNQEKAGIVFLASDYSSAVNFIKAIKDIGISNPLIVPDVMNDKAFCEAFNIFPQEKENPGYYTNGIYIPSVLLFDTANARTQIFRNNYQNKYDKMPEVNDTLSYDAAIVLLNAMKNSDIAGAKDDLEKDRRKIRPNLSDFF